MPPPSSSSATRGKSPPGRQLPTARPLTYRDSTYRQPLSCPEFSPADPTVVLRRVLSPLACLAHLIPDDDDLFLGGDADPVTATLAPPPTTTSGRIDPTWLSAIYGLAPIDKYATSPERHEQVAFAMSRDAATQCAMPYRDYMPCPGSGPVSAAASQVTEYVAVDDAKVPTLMEQSPPVFASATPAAAPRRAWMDTILGPSAAVPTAPSAPAEIIATTSSIPVTSYLTVDAMCNDYSMGSSDSTTLAADEVDPSPMVMPYSLGRSTTSRKRIMEELVEELKQAEDYDAIQTLKVIEEM